MMVPVAKVEPKRGKRKTYLTILYVLVGVSLIFVVTAAVVSRYRNSSGKTRQAVFVSTGSVYFGYVKDPNASMVQIDDVYYLTSIQSLYPEKDSKDKISLIKMGSEVYKPQTSVLINRDQVISIQDIDQTSQINKAISESLNKN